MNPVEKILAKMAFSGQKKVRMIRQIQRLIKSGVPITQSLEMLWNLYSVNGKKPKEPLALMVREWQKNLNMGQSLARSMHGWVSIPEELIIEAGEQSDRLASALQDALEAEGATRGIRNAIIGGMIYPLVLLAALIFMLWGFSTEIVPTFETILPASEWTGSAATMYSVSQFVITWLPLFGMVLGGALTATFLSMPILVGPVRKYLDYLPPWSIYKITQGAAFMIAMRGFISAGATVPDALRKMLKIGNPYFKERISAIVQKINMGRNLGEAMREAGHNFPGNEIAGEVSIYAELDEFDKSLDLVAKEWINNSVDRAKASAKLMNNVMLFAVAITVGAIATTMFELQDLVSQAAQ
jgi:type II secretory pathway component PulF